MENTYDTGGGKLTTKYESNVHFTLAEFSDKIIINWKFNLFETEDLGYDMVIGRDILASIGIDISFKEKTISCEGIAIPIRDFNSLRKY